MKFTEYLTEHIDSHDLVDLDYLFESAAQKVSNVTFSRGTPPEVWHIETLDEPRRSARVMGRSVAEINRTMGVAVAGPKGLMLADDADLSATAMPAWVLMSRLAKDFTGDAPGDQFFGRGSAYRANLKALRDAGL